MARGFKFLIEVKEGFHYPYSENKGADQLRSYCAKTGFLTSRLILFEVIFLLPDSCYNTEEAARKCVVPYMYIGSYQMNLCR